ncbi:MAG: hypothetical protein B7Y41_03145 [Hydrogenophilales bacterium 28-61-23]|nr:MAG: hypothetical protein B7Y41_03145 [Hydrogenophilales bacterium 28-61-23]
MSPLSAPPLRTLPTGRRAFLRQVSGLALAPWLAGCAEPGRPLTIANQVWPGYELMRLAQREGWLPKTGLALMDVASSKESLQALAEGRADGAGLTLDELLSARASGLPLTAVLVFDVSAGADALLVRPGIVRLPDLAGKRIGVEETPLGKFILHHVLTAAGLTPGDVTLVYHNHDRHLDIWKAGGVDALVTFEPGASLLEAQGAHRLFDSRQMPDTVFDVLAVRSDTLEKHGEALRGLVAGHFRGLEHLRANPQDAAFRMARRLKLPGQDVLQAFRGLDLPDLHANRRYLNGTLAAVARQLSGIMLTAGMLPVPDRLERLSSAEYLPRED